MDSPRTLRFLNVALAVAKTSQARTKHGAVVVRHNSILGVSPNLVRNNPRYVDFRLCHVHAEIAALKRANFPRKATVYVARINNQGLTRLSMPCVNCQTVIDGLGCKVHWTITPTKENE